MKRYGLIGFPVKYSFSQNYFTEKFYKEGIENALYELFEIKDIAEIKQLITNHPDLVGLNVTKPYKEQVIPFLDQLDESARKIGAVNVIKIENGQLKGFNSDYFGFKNSLKAWLPHTDIKALMLGNGGAAKAVMVALDDLKIPYQIVSRTPHSGQITYETLHTEPHWLETHQLLINCTPLGMQPDVHLGPDLPYDLVTSEHYGYDLIYNPEETYFMRKISVKGGKVKNGLEMLYLQAEKSWEIWQSDMD
ncbi:shikimate dehydrogenase family protein [Penaeicola halotolerans]|uniref:shikimate dehydrogenase family protein n=1 Tax=Penaeicola halotolerans TaxID=2793196 RepID=UPI001CF88F96|nr:shikimate dehydrogenase [Penaeicola halotolerans]